MSTPIIHGYQIYRAANIDISSVNQRRARPVSRYKCMKYANITSKLKHGLTLILLSNIHIPSEYFMDSMYKVAINKPIMLDIIKCTQMICKTNV